MQRDQRRHRSSSVGVTNNAAYSSNIPSPAELLNGRMFKSTLPGKIQPLKNQEEVINRLKVIQDNQSYYYNRHTKKFPKLHRDQAINAQDPVRKTWNPARVAEEGDSPRSYIVETGTGAHLRRNRIHLRPNNAFNNLANNLSGLIPQLKKNDVTIFKRQVRKAHASGQFSKQPVE